MTVLQFLSLPTPPLGGVGRRCRAFNRDSNIIHPGSSCFLKGQEHMNKFRFSLKVVFAVYDMRVKGANVMWPCSLMTIICGFMQPTCNISVCTDFPSHYILLLALSSYCSRLVRSSARLPTAMRAISSWHRMAHPHLGAFNVGEGGGRKAECPCGLS